MSTVVVQDARAYLGGYNLSGYANEMHLELNPDMLDQTRFGTSRTRDFKPGLQAVKASLKGYTEFTYPLGSPSSDLLNSLDAIKFAYIGAAIDVFSCSAMSAAAAEGDVAYTMNHVVGKSDPIAGSIGQLAPFDIDLHATGIRPVRGVIAGVGSKTATGQTGVTFQPGLVATGQSLYAALHVYSQSGTTPTLAVIIESDDNSGFTTPTTRLTFSGVTTTLGAQWQSLAGPIATDTYFRAKWTIGGTVPVYGVFIVIGVL